MLLKEENMIRPKYSKKGWSVAIKNIGVFRHMLKFVGEEAVTRQTWHLYCEDKTNGVNFRKL